MWKIVPDASVRYAALQDNQAGVIYYPPADEWKTIEDSSNEAIFTHERPGSPNSIQFNVAEAPLNSLAVRQAVLYGDNEKANLESAYLGTYPYVASPLVPGTPDYDPAFANAYPSDPAKAEQLLNQAGWTGKNSAGYRTKDGQVLKITVPYDDDAGQTAAEDLTLYQDIQASEKQIGVDIVLDPVSTAQDNALYESHKYQATAGDYWITNTPDVLRTLFSTQATKLYGTNSTSYSNPTLDNLLEKGLTDLNAAQAKIDYDKAQAIVSNAALQINLYPAEERLAYNKDVHGISADYAVGLPDFYDTWISK